MVQTTNNVGVTIVAPTIGVVLNFCMWYAPYKAVAAVRKAKSLGTLNPYPYSLTLTNCVGWVIYGAMTRNFYLIFSNTAGISSSLWYSMSLLPYCRESEREIIEAVLIGALISWGAIGLIIICMFPDSSTGFDAATLFEGYVATFFTLGLYGGGLSKFYEVFKERDSTSIHIGTAMINTVNSVMWVVYGAFALNDVNLYASAGAGLALSVLQLFCICIFPRTREKQAKQMAAKQNDAMATVENPLQIQQLEHKPQPVPQSDETEI